MKIYIFFFYLLVFSMLIFFLITIIYVYITNSCLQIVLCVNTHAHIHKHAHSTAHYVLGVMALQIGDKKTVHVGDNTQIKTKIFSA